MRIPIRDQIKAWWGGVLIGLLWLLGYACKPLRLCRRYRSLLIGLLKRQQLFDRSFYLSSNPDVLQSKMPPLRHYVSYGDREGRWPMPLFDPSYYRREIKGVARQFNTLLHYAYVGRFLRLAPSPFFDLGYYLDNNPDVVSSGCDPLLHYLTWGGIEGRSPNTEFDGAYYLRSNPEVANARINPLLHYLRRGRLEGRPAVPGWGSESPHGVSVDLAPIEPPDPECWSELGPRAGVDNAGIDVVVPVYNGRLETLRCLYSVLSASSVTPFELVVINDVSPDRDLSAELRDLAEQGLFTLIENTKNRGFVGTANLGMRLHPTRDVVLLNADTEVYGNWLDRLRCVAYRHDRCGTVTPLSNNATICSYPEFLHDNASLLEVSFAELDDLASRVNYGMEVESPTGVGFCLYLKRACLDATGFFDESVFGRGYGEENDLCQRAITRGWLNLIAVEVFVHHCGGASFQGEKAKRTQAALKVLDKRYPRYREQVAEFIQRDPLEVARRRLDWARMKRTCRDRNVLIICHRRGGGTERHVREEFERFLQAGLGVFLLRPASGNPAFASLESPLIHSIPNLSLLRLSDTSRLRSTLAEIGINEIYTHSLVDFEPQAMTDLARLVRTMGVVWEVRIHDYEVICPRLNLVDENGHYCGEPSDAGCNRCLRSRGSAREVTDIGAWRSLHRDSLLACDRVLVPDEDVSLRLGRYYPEIRFQVSPHEEIGLDELSLEPIPRDPGEWQRVVVLGAIDRLKGYDVLQACARDARNRRLPLEFILMGYSMNDSLLEEAGVRLTGRYQEQEALDKLRALRPHVVWLPSLWPETYSYTLSIALKAGYPIFAFDLGAIAARLRRLGRADHLMAIELARRPRDLNDLFLTHAETTDVRERYAAS